MASSLQMHANLLRSLTERHVGTLKNCVLQGVNGTGAQPSRIDMFISEENVTMLDDGIRFRCPR